MKRTLLHPALALFLGLALVPALMLAGCSDQDEGTGEVLIRINDYSLTREEFRRRLADEMRYYGETELTEEMKAQFLDQLVRKELLIQEAVRMEMDRREEFVRAIERYWETTLIGDVLDHKAEDVRSLTLVGQEEIAERYAEMLAANPDLPPLDQMHDEVRRALEEEKMTQALEDWIQELKDGADIEIDADVYDSF